MSASRSAKPTSTQRGVVKRRSASGPCVLCTRPKQAEFTPSELDYRYITFPYLGLKRII